MLSLIKQGDGDLSVKNVISYIRNATHQVIAIRECIVTAVVNNVVVVDSDVIRCQFQIETNFSVIYIYWEEYGYKNYRQLGLYGQMRTDYQLIKLRGPKTLCITDELGAYEITIRY